MPRQDADDARCWSIICDQYNWSRRARCTHPAFWRVTFDNPHDVWNVCNGHMLNIGRKMSNGSLTVVDVQRNALYSSTPCCDKHTSKV